MQALGEDGEIAVRVIAEKAGDQAGVAVSLRARGEIAAWRRESDRAAEILLKARRAFVAIEDRYGEASVLQVLARVQVTLGRIQSAQKCLEEALELANAIGDPQVKACVLLNIGAFCADWRGAEGAENALNEALALFHQTGNRLVRQYWGARVRKARKPRFQGTGEDRAADGRNRGRQLSS